MNAFLRKYYNPWTVLATVVLLLGIYLSALYGWMNHWGLTSAEASMSLPGDGTQPGMGITSTRGVTIHAPASAVWMWVVQLGQDRAGFYSNDWLENLVLSDIHNSDSIRPEWQHRSVGEAILGAGGAIYQRTSFWPTLAYEDGKMLYLWGPIVVLPADSQTSRLLIRTYAAPPPSALVGILKALTYDWMHFVMERGLLLGIKARAEGTLDADWIPQAIADLGWIAATVGVAAILFFRRRGWWWGLIPLAYAAAILAITADFWSAVAGFLWWGIIAVGFLLLGKSWWKGLALATILVMLVFVIAPQPHIAFGMIFLVIAAAFLGTGAVRRQAIIRP